MSTAVLDVKKADMFSGESSTTDSRLKAPATSPSSKRNASICSTAHASTTTTESSESTSRVRSASCDSEMDSCSSQGTPAHEMEIGSLPCSPAVLGATLEDKLEACSRESQQASYSSSSSVPMNVADDSDSSVSDLSASLGVHEDARWSKQPNSPRLRAALGISITSTHPMCGSSKAPSTSSSTTTSNSSSAATTSSSTTSTTSSASASSTGSSSASTSSSTDSSTSLETAGEVTIREDSNNGAREITGHISREALVNLLALTLEKTFCTDPSPKPITSPNDSMHPAFYMFQCKVIPGVTLQQYFQHVAKYSGCSNECLILSLVHIARIYRLHSDFAVNLLTIHRLLLTSIMISAKFFDDCFLNNSRFARIGGVRPRELNNLEVEFLFLLNFSLFVTEDEYIRIYRELVTMSPLLPYVVKVNFVSTPSTPSATPTQALRSLSISSPIHRDKSASIPPPTPTNIPSPAAHASTSSISVGTLSAFSSPVYVPPLTVLLSNSNQVTPSNSARGSNSSRSSTSSRCSARGSGDQSSLVSALQCIVEQAQSATPAPTQSTLLSSSASSAAVDCSASCAASASSVMQSFSASSCDSVATPMNTTNTNTSATNTAIGNSILKAWAINYSVAPPSTCATSLSSSASCCTLVRPSQQTPSDPMSTSPMPGASNSTTSISPSQPRVLAPLRNPFTGSSSLNSNNAMSDIPVPIPVPVVVNAHLDLSKCKNAAALFSPPGSLRSQSQSSTPNSERTILRSQSQRGANIIIINAAGHAHRSATGSGNNSGNNSGTRSPVSATRASSERGGVILPRLITSTMMNNSATTVAPTATTTTSAATLRTICRSASPNPTPLTVTPYQSSSSSASSSTSAASVYTPPSRLALSPLHRLSNSNMSTSAAAAGGFTFTNTMNNTTTSTSTSTSNVSRFQFPTSQTRNKY